MIINDKSYFTISGFMLNRLGLKGGELLVYALIHSFSIRTGTEFYGTREYIREFTGLSINTVDKCIKSLLDKGLIIKMDGISYRKSNVYTANRDYVIDEKSGTTVGTAHLGQNVEKYAQITVSEISTSQKCALQSPNLGSNNKEYLTQNNDNDQKRPFGEEIGNMISMTFGREGFVRMTPNQYANLKSRMGEEMLTAYIRRLELFMKSPQCKFVGNHYKTILKWHKEASEVEDFNPKVRLYK